MNALDNGMPANTVGLFYSSNYVQHLVQVFVSKSFAILSQYIEKALK